MVPLGRACMSTAGMLLPSFTQKGPRQPQQPSAGYTWCTRACSQSGQGHELQLAGADNLLEESTQDVNLPVGVSQAEVQPQRCKEEYGCQGAQRDEDCLPVGPHIRDYDHFDLLIVLWQACRADVKRFGEAGPITGALPHAEGSNAHPLLW